MLRYEPVIVALVLLVTANGAPIIVASVLGSRWDAPVDLRTVWRDGRALLGPDKTWRGIAAAIVAATLVSPLLGWSPLYGGLFGALAMLGDLLSSYCKRRLGVASGDSVVGFDQLFEALLPSVCFASSLGLDWVDVVVIVVAFALIDMLASRLLYALHMRKRPW